MRQIGTWEKELMADSKNRDMNITLLQAYRAAQECDNERIDFFDVIWDYDVEPIVNACREVGVTEITISSTMSGLIETLDKFMGLGCAIGEIVKVRKHYKDWGFNDYKKIPAILIKIN